MPERNLTPAAAVISVGIIGAAALVAQIVLLRESFTLFAGNELIYGLVMFLWLVGYGTSSWLGGKLTSKIKDPLWVFVFLQVIFTVWLPAEIYLCRNIKYLMGIPFGLTADLPLTILILLILLLPITLILGVLFPLGSLILAKIVQNKSSSISLVYIAESVGSILGGVGLSYILLFFLNAFQLAALTSLALSLSIIFVCCQLNRQRLFWFGLTTVLFSLLVLAGAGSLNHFSIQQSLGHYHLKTTADSPYGRIIVSADRGNYNFYENGAFLFSSADQLGNEEIAHLSLLLHPHPSKILLIGGGSSQVINELAKYPLSTLHYVDFDYKLFALSRQYLPLDPKAEIFMQDGLHYLKETPHKYDVILVNLPSPTTAQINRFYTLEFFKLCQEKLNPGGMVTFHLETSDSYLGRELKQLNQIVFKTVAAVFAQVSVIPGNHNYFFASATKLNDSPRELISRWQKRQIKTVFFRPDTLAFILWPDKTAYVREAIKYFPQTPVNTELNPVSYYYGLLLWASQLSESSVKKLLYQPITSTPSWLAIALILVLLALKFLSLKVSRIKIPLIIFGLGFIGLSLQLVIIYAFEAFYGYLYHAIGLLTTLFMAGLASGSFIIYRLDKKIVQPEPSLKIVLGIMFMIIMMILLTLRSFPLPVASFLVAFPVGAAFPLAVKGQAKYQPDIGALSGILYGADLAGGALAAILTTIFLIPLWGLLPSLALNLLLTAGLSLFFSKNLG